MNEKKENVIVNGFFWRFAERCGVQLISAVVSILLARILTPDDYGKVALVTVFNNIMYVLLDCGIGTALVQKKEVDELDYSSAFFFSIVLSFVLYGGMFVAAPYLAVFYNDPSNLRCCFLWGKIRERQLRCGQNWQRPGSKDRG